MLAITKNGIECSVEDIRDVEPNEGGAWCTIHPYDKNGDCWEDYIDDVCIHPEDCPNEGIYNECGGLTAEAEEFLRKYVGEQTYDIGDE